MLCDRIHEVLSAEKEEAPVIDIAKWISRASFNTMARAALDYDFQALSDTPDEVYTAVMRLVETVGKGMTNRDGIEIYLPFLRWIFVCCPLSYRSGSNVYSSPARRASSLPNATGQSPKLG